ncbi:MAG TPA: hypothetical protein VFI22_09230, partial [Thermomicrobiales bacterium]|nr:hypothetical protein [Thermomicrobiales bacterium]
MRPRRSFRRINASFARVVSPLLALALLVALATPVAAAPPGLPAAVAWLTGQQQADGGYPGYGGVS